MAILSKTLKVKSVLALVGTLACSMNCGTALTLKEKDPFGEQKLTPSQKIAAEARQQGEYLMLDNLLRQVTEERRGNYLSMKFGEKKLQDGYSVAHVMPTMPEGRLAQKQLTAAARIRESEARKEAENASSLRKRTQAETLSENVAGLQEIRATKRWKFVEDKILDAPWGGLTEDEMKEQQNNHTDWKPFQLLFTGQSRQNGLKKVGRNSSASDTAKEVAQNLSPADFRKMKNLAYLAGPGHFEGVVPMKHSSVGATIISKKSKRRNQKAKKDHEARLQKAKKDHEARLAHAKAQEKTNVVIPMLCTKGDRVKGKDAFVLTTPQDITSDIYLKLIPSEGKAQICKKINNVEAVLGEVTGVDAPQKLLESSEL